MRNSAAILCLLGLLAASLKAFSYSAYSGPPRNYTLIRNLQEAQSLAKSTGAAGPYIFDVDIVGFFGVSLDAQDGELTLGVFPYQQYLHVEFD
jgi:hypothetical protein